MVEMLNKPCIKDKHKTIAGILSIVFCIITLCSIQLIQPVYIEWYLLLLSLLCLIPAIGLIMFKDSKNNCIFLGIFTLCLAILMLYVSGNGLSNVYHTLTDLYLTNQMSHVPTLREINDCTTAYWLMIGYAIYNILCGILFFISTSSDTFISIEKLDAEKQDNKISSLTLKLTDTDGSALSNKKIKLNNGKSVITDSNGLVNIDNPDVDRITFYYEGDDNILNRQNPSQEVNINIDEVDRIQNVPFPAYQSDGKYIFASYAHANWQGVYSELKRFNDDGYHVWYDEGVPCGIQWDDVIADALDKCSLFVVFITPDSVASPNVKNEISYAIKLKKVIIPIYIEPTILKKGLQLRLADVQSIFKYAMGEEQYVSAYKNSFNKFLNDDDD